MHGIQGEVTATSFRVVVSEAEPYSFQECASQQVHSSVRITHITFTPPGAEELRAHAQRRRKLSAADPRPATLARVRSLTAAGASESFVVACFPHAPAGGAGGAGEPAGPGGAGGAGGAAGAGAAAESPRAAAGAGAEAEAESPKAGGAGGAGAGAGACVRLGGLFDVALPRPTDVCCSVDLRLDADGSVWLEVDGPGSVTLFGEQYAALIPEWLSHQFFSVGEDDEEGEEIDDAEGDDFAEMYQLIY